MSHDMWSGTRGANSPTVFLPGDRRSLKSSQALQSASRHRFCRYSPEGMTSASPVRYLGTAHRTKLRSARHPGPQFPAPLIGSTRTILVVRSRILSSYGALHQWSLKGAATPTSPMLESNHCRSSLMVSAFPEWQL